MLKMDLMQSDIARCSHVGLACRIGDSDNLRVLLENGAPTDVHDNRGWYPLHEVAYSDHTHCLQMLLEHSPSTPDINCRSYEGASPLLVACERGQINSVRILLSHGADPNLGSLDQKLPLKAAVGNGSIAVVEALLKAGANPNGTYFNGWTAMHEAACGGHSELLQTLHDAGGDLTVTDDEHLTPIFVATQYGRLHALRTLLQLAGDRATALVNMQAKDGGSCVYVAAQEGYDRCVQTLIEHGASVDLLTEERIHPCVAPLRSNFWRCLALILSRADLDAIINSDQDPVLLAAEAGSYDCLKLLLDAGLSPDRPTAYTTVNATNTYLMPLLNLGFITPLGKACTKGRIDCARLLLDRDARQLITDPLYDTYSPLCFAILKRQRPELLAAFLAKDAPVNGVVPSIYSNGVPAACLIALHPNYRRQLITLLRCGLRPNLRGFCGCQCPPDSTPLLDELRRVFSPTDLCQLFKLFILFEPRPSCCNEWRNAIGENLWSNDFEALPTLQFFARRTIRRQITTSQLHEMNWVDQIGFPAPLRSYVLYDNEEMKSTGQQN